MVIRGISVPDALDLPEFDEVFRAVRGWDNIGFLFRAHGQEFNRFRRASRSKTLRDFQLRPRQTFLYTCGAIDLWEWEFRLLDQPAGADGDAARRWRTALPVSCFLPATGRQNLPLLCTDRPGVNRDVIHEKMRWRQDFSTCTSSRPKLSDFS
jgi:hypothetical protein